jgi:hypothetical protein
VSICLICDDDDKRSLLKFNKKKGHVVCLPCFAYKHGFEKWDENRKSNNPVEVENVIATVNSSLTNNYHCPIADCQESYDRKDIIQIMKKLAKRN